MNSGTASWKPIAFLGALLFAVGIGYFLARLSAPAPEAPGASLVAPTEPDTLNVDESYLAVVGIATEKVVQGNLNTDILAPATVTAAPNGEAVVTARATGTVVRLATQLGDPVREGETLALVESREAAAMAADRTIAETKAALARSALMREQELYAQRVTPRQDLERAQAELAVAEAELRRAMETAAAAHVTDDGRIAVVSPISGRVTSAMAALGTFVQPNAELFRVADPRFIQIGAAVTATDASRITVGDPATILTRSGASIAATVRSITPTLNQETRAATVILSLDEDHEPLAPGEVVQATIMPRNATPGGVIVPEDAVQNIGGRNVVFVRNATGFRVQPVVIGARSAGRVSVTSGLAPGETIATTNAFFLKAELGKGVGEGE